MLRAARSFFSFFCPALWTAARRCRSCAVDVASCWGEREIFINQQEIVLVERVEQHRQRAALPARSREVVVDAVDSAERKKTDNREGWEDGTPPPHREFNVDSAAFVSSCASFLYKMNSGARDAAQTGHKSFISLRSLNPVSRSREAVFYTHPHHPIAGPSGAVKTGPTSSQPQTPYPERSRNPAGGEAQPSSLWTYFHYPHARRAAPVPAKALSPRPA